MFLLVPTCSEEFRSLIQRSIFRMEENVMFFLYTKSADVGYGIVCCSSFNYIPIYCVWCIHSLQCVDISAQTGPIDIWMSHVIGMIPVSAFHGLGSGTCVGFHLVGVSSCDCSPVDHIVNQASSSRQNWAGFRCFRSTLTTTSKGLLNWSCSIDTIQNFIVG